MPNGTTVGTGCACLDDHSTRDSTMATRVASFERTDGAVRSPFGPSSWREGYTPRGVVYWAADRSVATPPREVAVGRTWHEERGWLLCAPEPGLARMRMLTDGRLAMD